VAEVVIAIAVVRGYRSRHIRKRSLAAFVAATIMVAVLLFTWVDPGIVTQKLSLIVKMGRPAWGEWAEFRKTVASDSLRMLRDHPVTGVGLGNFETAYPHYQSFPSDLWIDYAHNDYVQAAAETGLVGAALIVSALALFLHLAFTSNPGPGVEGQARILESGNSAEDAEQARGDGEEDTEASVLDTDSANGRWIRLGAALGCCGMLVHSFFDFNLHIPANAAWFAVLAGIACCHRR
jgi:O-antigen ligase